MVNQPVVRLDSNLLGAGGRVWGHRVTLGTSVALVLFAAVTVGALVTWLAYARLGLMPSRVPSVFGVSALLTVLTGAVFIVWPIVSDLITSEGRA